MILLITRIDGKELVAELRGKATAYPLELTIAGVRYTRHDLDCVKGELYYWRVSQ